MQSKIKKIIKSEWSKPKINFIEEFPEGYNNISFDVKINNPNKRIVVKIIEDGSIHGSKKEQTIFNLLREKFPKYPVPKVLCFDDSKEIIDEAYIITERLPGDTLRRKSSEIENIGEIFEKLGELKGKLHQIKYENYGKLDKNLSLKKKYDDLVKRRKNKFEKKIKSLSNRGYIDNNFIKKQKQSWKNFSHLLKKESSPVLIQKDTSLSNIIVDGVEGNHEITGIIDFEFARSGGKVEDICMPGRNYELVEENKDHLVNGYKKHNQLPNDWRKLWWFYIWETQISRLYQIPGMSWRGLNKSETKNRKENLVKKYKKRLKQAKNKLNSL